MVVPVTVQTGSVCELKLTANPELAVALSAGGAEPLKGKLLSGAKVIVWGIKLW